ncbi:hypothetical protein J437_LFUL003388, partial [Ladona fulva]
MRVFTMAVWTADESEQLIKLVRQNHTLYDPSSNDYRNRDVLKTLWTNIADEMNRSGRIFLTDMDCRDRWNTLRDGYRRFIKDDQTTSNGSKPKKRKTWQWAEDMSFLKPFIQERISIVTSGESTCNRNQRNQSSTNNIVLRGAVDNNSGGNNVGKDVVCAALSDTPSDDASTSYIVHIVADNTDTSRVTSRGDSNGVISVDCAQDKNNRQEESNNPKTVSKSQETRSSSVQPTGNNENNVSPVIITHHPVSTHEDSDEQFFRSLLPDVKSLSPRQKGLFKIKVQQLLQEMLYPKEYNSAAILQQPRTSEQRPLSSQVTYGAYGNMYQSERWTSAHNS